MNQFIFTRRTQEIGTLPDRYNSCLSFPLYQFTTTGNLFGMVIFLQEMVNCELKVNVCSSFGHIENQDGRNTI